MNNINAVIVCGGRGSRMGKIMGSFKCKSLIPVLGIPSLTYVLKALKRINCSMCILSIERSELYDDIEHIATQSSLPFVIHMDSGRGPTTVAQEAASKVSSARFLMLYGHQIVFPNHLERMIATNLDFVATVYKDSSEGIRKIATLSPSGLCIRLRRGSSESPALDNELYLDVPYLLQTKAIRDSNSSQGDFDPDTPADAGLRPHTILRYVSNLYTIPANFRHEFHYENELEDVAKIAAKFKEEIML